MFNPDYAVVVLTALIVCIVYHHILTPLVRTIWWQAMKLQERSNFLGT